MEETKEQQIDTKTQATSNKKLPDCCCYICGLPDRNRNIYRHLESMHQVDKTFLNRKPYLLQNEIPVNPWCNYWKEHQKDKNYECREEYLHKFSYKRQRHRYAKTTIGQLGKRTAQQLDEIYPGDSVSQQIDHEFELPDQNIQDSEQKPTFAFFAQNAQNADANQKTQMQIQNMQTIAISSNSFIDQVNQLVTFLKQTSDELVLMAQVNQYLSKFKDQQMLVYKRYMTKEQAQIITQQLLKLRSRPVVLSGEGLVGFCNLAAAVGGQLFESLNHILISSSHTQAIINLISQSYRGVYGKEVGDWVLNNWKYINSGTHQVFQYIEENLFDLSNKQQLCMLTMHTLVDITNKHTEFISACSILSTSNWCLSAIKCANKGRQAVFSLDYFRDLVLWITQRDNEAVYDVIHERIEEFCISEWKYQLEKILQSAQHEDSQSSDAYIQVMKDKYTEFNLNIEEQATKSLLDPKGNIISVFNETEYLKPSKKQLAISVLAAVYAQKKKSYTLYQVGAGMGKSRIIACLSYILLQKKNISIDLVFSNEELMKRDRKLYENWLISYNLNDCIKFHSSIDDLRKNSYVIIDEADQHVYSGSVIKRANHKGIIGFTATVKSISQGAEQSWLTRNNIQVFDSGLHPEEKQISMATREAMINAIDTRLTPIIVYCSDELCEEFISKYKNPLVNETDDEVLKALDSYMPYPLVLVTKPELMRGFDYRSKIGIHLYITKQFSHERHLNQAVHRVGRNGEPCQVFKTVDQLINEKEKATEISLITKKFK